MRIKEFCGKCDSISSRKNYKKLIANPNNIIWYLQGKGEMQTYWLMDSDRTAKGGTKEK